MILQHTSSPCRKIEAQITKNDFDQRIIDIAFLCFGRYNKRKLRDIAMIDNLLSIVIPSKNA